MGEASSGGPDDDLPLYQPPFGLETVPVLLAPLVAPLIAGETAEEFGFEGVDVVESAQGARHGWPEPSAPQPEARPRAMIPDALPAQAAIVAASITKR